MPERECRWETCHIHAGENGYFCAAHWRQLSLEVRHRLLGFPIRPGLPQPGRNQALHAALTEIRQLAHPGSRDDATPDLGLDAGAASTGG